jgi:hypothetical protein
MAKRIPKKFSMFSKAGNRAVEQMLTAVLTKHGNSDLDVFCRAVWLGMKEISGVHEEVLDTVVRERILYAVEILKPEFSLNDLYPRIKFGKFGN